MTLSHVIAFSPGHISGYFKPFLSDDPRTSGSMGGGIVINEGVTVTATLAETNRVTVFMKEKTGEFIQVSDDSPVIRQLLENLQVHASIETRCTLPLSSGYGLSAAALLATVYAVNTLCHLGLNHNECAFHAHQVEVLFRTGLGDVSACQGGGWVVRRGPGIDADIIRTQDFRLINAVTLGPLKTTSVLSSPDMMTRISTAFPHTEPLTLEELFRNSRMFAEESGLISDNIRKVLIECDANDIPASMTMLGNGVFALGEQATAVLSPFGRVYSLNIAECGPKILEPGA